VDQIISALPLRWALPFFLAAAVYAVFRFVNDHVSSEIRSDFKEFLQGKAYEGRIAALSEISQRTFFAVFGDRHLSLKCISRSALFSIFSVAFTFVVSAIWNHGEVTGVFASISRGFDRIRESQDTNVASFHSLIAHYPNFVVWGAIAAVWIIWCLIPDYLSLLKVRIVLTVLKYTKPRLPYLITTLAVDFLVALWTFLVSVSVLQSILVFAFAKYLGTSALLNSQSLFGLFTAMIVMSGLIFTIEGSILTMSAAIFFAYIIANLFWASTLPSIWLWIHVLASLFTRACMISRPLLLNFLDIDAKPFTSVGVVAAFWMFVGSGLLQIVIAAI